MAKKAQDRPNIVWIYCDELRTDALGCYGNPYVALQTPHIDSVAATGLRFDNCFCNSPVCVPSRTSTLTGLYPEETGVYHNEAVWANYRLENPPVTWPALLAQEGYRTANFGKVHVPDALQVWQHSEEAGAGMREFYNYATAEEMALIQPPIPIVIGGSYPPGRPYPSEQLTANAIRWMSGVDGPFLVRLSYLQPHTPVITPQPYDTLYASVPFPDQVTPNPHASRFERRFAEVLQIDALSPEQFVQAQVHYYGLVAWLDSQVGQVLTFLRQSGQLENTIIVFESDHGTSLGEAGRYQKQTFAPESHRVPRLISWPGVLPQGQVRPDICESLDLARTLFGLVEVEIPEHFRGRNVLTEPAPEAVYSTIGYGFADSRIFPNLGVGDYVNGHGWPRRSCVRTERYRLDKNVRMDGKPVSAQEEDRFLVDVQMDPAEGVNLANDPAYAQVVAELSARIDAHCANAVEPAWELTQRTAREAR